MSRKKVVKSAAKKNRKTKQATKTPTKANALLKLELDFSEAPAKIATQLTKEIAAHKQKENKLNTTLTKITKQIAKIEKTIVAAKKQRTATGRKQLTAAKKALNDTKKDYSLSNAALKDTAKQIAATELKLARISALTKSLKAFDKDWAKQAKKLKAVAKTKAAKASAKAKGKGKTKAKSTKRRTTAKKAVTTLTMIEQPDFDNIGNTTDESQHDDMRQVNS
tara:strand:+ start:365 stop:1030 length:666 start_codon:yes stop_codon:yes gene_type:complete